MGAGVSRTDFDWADDYHTHNRRRAIILKKYPEIRKLMTYDPVFKWKVLAMVAAQIISFVLLSSVSSFWVFFISAYFFGGVINHSLTLAIHDISHNQAYGYGRPLANRLFGMVANLPMGIPTSVTFKKYHADHHAFLGKQADTDLPTEWEGRFFNTSPRKILWLILNPLFYAIRPMVVSPKPIEALEVLNLIVQFSFDYVIVRYLGWHILLYMILSSLVCMGLHPIAGHFLSEHYVFFYEEDYLEKLRVHQKELSEKLLVPETFSYYGPWNLLTYNVGYHVEHHDFPNIPSSLLPEVRRIAAEFYEPLCYHTSWTRALLRYILDPRMGPFARIRRKELFVEYMNTNKAAAENEADGTAVNGVDHNGNATDLSQQKQRQQKHSNGVHLNGAGETRNGGNFRGRKAAASTQDKLSVKESENELIKAHYTFYE